MGKALQVISGRVTNPGAAITALTPNTGDSFAIRSFDFSAAAGIEELWGFNAAGGTARIRSPRLHDQAQGIRVAVPAGQSAPIMPYPAVQPVYPQDVLTVESSGGGAETDLLSFLVYYANLPGVDANLASWDEIKPRIRNIVGVEVDLTSGATIGDYGGAKALNANFDTLKRNVNYAVLGAVTPVACGTLGLFGPDTGNLRVGIPGLLRPEVTGWWFALLSEKYGTPHIPIINAANVAATTVDVTHNAAGTTINPTFALAELGS